LQHNTSMTECIRCMLLKAIAPFALPITAVVPHHSENDVIVFRPAALLLLQYVTHLLKQLESFALKLLDPQQLPDGRLHNLRA